MATRISASYQFLRGLRRSARRGTLGDPMPDRVMRAAALRFGRLAVGLVSLKLALLALLWGTGLLGRYDLGWTDVAGQVSYFVGGLGVWWLSRGDRVAPARLLDLGYLWEIFTALQISLFVNAGPWPDVVLRGWSPTVAWAVVVALMVPGPPLKAALAAGLTLATEPLSLWIHVSQGMPMPTHQVLLDRFAPAVGAFLLILFLTSYVFRVEWRLAEADEVGSYRLIEKLGEGGMGEVWRAQHRLLARPAAVKLIRPDALGPRADTTVQRFEREAQATATLQSPHTVAVYDFGHTDDGRMFYVMELLDGLDLETLVERHGPLPPARVAHLLRQACRSLAEAHAHGLVHRDVKPANLFVCRHGGEADVLKVLDFGLVRHRAEAGADDPGLTHDGQLTGTPAYAAPEQCLGGAITPATDLYALGCVASWLLTGRPVFEGPTAMALVAQHLRDAPPRPSSRVEGVPPDLDALVLRCLEKAPADRPADAAEVADALQALARGWTAQSAESWWVEHGGAPPPREDPATRAQ